MQPAAGRLFHVSDEHGANSAPYIVLSYGFWRERFNGDPNVVGTTVDLNTHPFTVIGVAPREFQGTEIFFWPDFWIPMVEACLLYTSHQQRGAVSRQIGPPAHPRRKRHVLELSLIHI